MVCYGLQFPTHATRLDIELYCFRIGLAHSHGGIGKAGHFWECVKLLWGPKANREFIVTPWAEDMIDALCEYQYVGITGCAGSGKSETSAVWSIVNYISDPANTCVLITSTSLSAARKRIWGAVCDYWNAVPGLPGKLVNSVGMIRFEDPRGRLPSSDKVGIFLIAAEQKQEKAAVQKLIGFHANHVMLVGDEFPHLSPAILEAAMSNLTQNPRFSCVGLGNFSSIYDNLGRMCEPIGGWGVIHPDMEGWKTKMGYCLHLDGEKSPNVLAGKVIYPFLMTTDRIEKARRDLGENSLAYWSQVKGYPAPEGASGGLYSESDFFTYGADNSEVQWATA